LHCECFQKDLISLYNFNRFIYSIICRYTHSIPDSTTTLIAKTPICVLNNKLTFSCLIVSLVKTATDTSSLLCCYVLPQQIVHCYAATSTLVHTLVHTLEYYPLLPQQIVHCYAAMLFGGPRWACRSGSDVSTT
jgi:hypothetical protein